MLLIDLLWSNERSALIGFFLFCLVFSCMLGAASEQIIANTLQKHPQMSLSANTLNESNASIMICKGIKLLTKSEECALIACI